MDADLFGIVEMLLVFGVVMGILGWELVSVRRARRRDRDAEGPRDPREKP